MATGKRSRPSNREIDLKGRRVARVSLRDITEAARTERRQRSEEESGFKWLCAAEPPPAPENESRLITKRASLRDKIQRASTSTPLSLLQELSQVESELAAEMRKGTAQIDEFQWMVRLGVVIAPYVDPKRCVEVVTASDALSTCVAAMSVNVGGHGYDLVPVIDPAALQKIDPISRDNVHAEMAEEKKRIENFFDFCSAEVSWNELRQRTTWDKESDGYGAWEIIETEDGEIAGLEPMKAWTLRLTPLSDFVDAEVYRLDPSGNWQKVSQPRRFRLVVQIVQGQYRYFKQLGDPRVVNRYTGEVARNKEQATFWQENEQDATSVLMFSIYSPLSPYGVPRWLGATSSAQGRRVAGEVNLTLFNNNAIPPMAVLVSGGSLSEESYEALIDRLQQRKGVENYHEILVIETVPDGGDIDQTTKSAVRVQLQPMTDAQQKDGLFQQYRKDCREDVRTTFRLPPIVTGLAQDYNFATSEASMRVAEQQVWQPERDQEDRVVNHVLFPRMGVRFWKFRSKSARTSDEQATTALLSALGGQAAITPNEAREIAGPILGKELKPITEPWASVPFMFTQAKLQSGGSLASPSGPTSPPGISAPPPAETPADEKVKQAHDALLTALGQPVPVPASPAAGGPTQTPSVGGGSLPALEATATAAAPSPPEQEDKTEEHSEPRVLRIKIPESMVRGADVVNGVIQLREEVEAEIRRRAFIERVRDRAARIARGGKAG
jgi:PBSX family phage portal protein